MCNIWVSMFYINLTGQCEIKNYKLSIKKNLSSKKAEKVTEYCRDYFPAFRTSSEINRGIYCPIRSFPPPPLLR